MDYHLYRQFCNELLEERTRRRELLERWVTPVAELFRALAPLRSRCVAVPEDLFALYAVSRVSDYLLSFETGLHSWFFSQTGLTQFTQQSAFSPFHHEIVSVVNDPSATSVTVSDVVWPGFQFGDLLFCRAGVAVRAPSQLVDASVATSSRLYFTFRRQGRRAEDLSHGWGSNSQWRTLFDRFYADSNGFHLNYDGECYIGPGFTPGPAFVYEKAPLDERRELLIHRCRVRAPALPDEQNRNPFVDRLTLRRSTWPLDEADLVPAQEIQP